MELKPAPHSSGGRVAHDVSRWTPSVIEQVGWLVWSRTSDLVAAVLGVGEIDRSVGRQTATLTARRKCWRLPATEHQGHADRPPPQRPLPVRSATRNNAGAIVLADARSQRGTGTSPTKVAVRHAGETARCSPHLCADHREVYGHHRRSHRSTRSAAARTRPGSRRRSTPAATRRPTP